MKSLALQFFKSNSDIRDFLRSRVRFENQHARRAAVKIAAVDDAPFAPQTNLQSYGYQITPIGDVKQLSELENYNIVLCDLMGVGLHFDAKKQGASIIAEIKNNYPQKIVIAYTGASMSAPVARSAAESADRILKKDIDIEEWTSVLDAYVDEAIDPFIIWNKTRLRLVELNTDTKAILSLEDAYVRSILAKDASFPAVRNYLSSSSVGSDVRGIMQGLIASLIFKAIFGT